MLIRSTPGPGRQINLSMALLAMGGVGVMVEVEDNGLAAISNELLVGAEVKSPTGPRLLSTRCQARLGHLNLNN